MPEPLTLAQQADLLDEIVARCTMHNGDIANETFMRVVRAEIEELLFLSGRLRRMAPHQEKIARVVMGK